MNPVFTGNKTDRTQAELQQYILTCILTAGNRAQFAEQKANDITADVPDGMLPCDVLSKRSNLEDYLRSKKTGKYGYLAKAIRRICELDLTKATDAELRSIPGVSFKTSRIFMLRSRRNVHHAAIDTHTLKFLRENGVPNVSEKPPGSECEYLRLETELLRLFSEKYPNLTPAKADATVWESYRR